MVSFLIPLKQMRDGPFSDTQAPITERLMDFGNASVGGIAQRANQSNHIQTKLTVR